VGKIAFIVILVGQIVIRFPYRNNSKSHATGRQEQLLLFGLTIGAMLLPFVYIFTDWLSFADYPASGVVVSLGVLLVVVGLWLFWRAHTDLGKNWSSSLEIYDDHTLITRGVYEHIRHPMYAANWLLMLAQALLLSNWIAGLGGLVSFAFLYFLRVPKEEAMMAQQFGEPYQQYMARTGRVLPKRSG